MMKHKQAGYTLFELMIVAIIAGILFVIIGDQLISTFFIHQRQNRLLQAEGEVAAVQLRLNQLLKTVPGREVGYYSSKEFAIPTLPANGTINQQPIQLGLITPYKVNGLDAISIVYGRRDVPRLELVAVSTDDVNNRGTALAVTSALTDPNWDPGTLFSNNKFMLLVGGNGDPYRPKHTARLVRLTGKAKRNVQGGAPTREVVEFDYDLCETGSCGGQYPNLINTTTNTQLRNFVLGSTLVLLDTINLYVVPGTNRKQVISNEGGTFVPDAQGNFQINGGTNSFVGEADVFQVSYILDSGTVMPSPASPVVSWLNQITTVRVQVTRSLPAVKGNDLLSRTATVELPIVIRNLD